MPADTRPEHRRPWEEKPAIISGLLAFLIPGAGHFYQGRWVKGTIYFVCILGTFFGGMRMGEGAVVYNLPNNRFGVSLNYLAQMCVGLPAMPAWLQARRVKDPSNRPLYELPQPLNSRFSGWLIVSGPGRERSELPAEGVIELATTVQASIPETRGVFRGRVNGESVELPLAGDFLLERPISAGFTRQIQCSVVRQSDQHPHESRLLRGTIPRAFQDAYCTPPEPEKLQDLHGRLGKFYDLAIAFTMIAGLLNVLAIWDAVEGPAYGIGDEPHRLDAEPESSTASATSEPRDGRPVTATTRP